MTRGLVRAKKFGDRGNGSEPKQPDGGDGKGKGRAKTDPEFDVQAQTLKSIMKICGDNGVVANLHNHTYELVSAKFSLSHAAISAPQLLDCEALFGSE